ncbi:hypothetical protein ACFL1R_09535 [Candidatus Latescibacterota bacterium]
MALFFLYAAVFIYRSSFEIFGERYFSLFDDAMISMIYAKNFAHGYGFVWNPGGERVEGFTNPMWVLFMALIHLLPVAQSKISIFIQISGGLFLLASLYYVRKIALFISEGAPEVSSGAVLLTAFYYPLIYWSLMGMEVSILILAMSFIIWKTIQYLANDISPLLIYLGLGVCTLIRIDMAVPFLGVWMYIMLCKPTQRKKNLIYGLLIFTIFLSFQTAFRMIYFGEIFPNTYYLKMTGYPVYLRIIRGLYVLLQFIGKFNFILFLLPFGVLAYKRDRYKGLLAWVIIIQLLYSIYVGGDSWEVWGGSNRFISFVMPLFFILFFDSFVMIIKPVLETIESAKRLPKKVRAFSLAYAFPLLFILAIIQFNGFSLSEFTLLALPYQVTYNKEMAERAEMIRDLTSEDATVAVTWAGAIPYFSNRTAVDILGKCDRHISRMEAKISTKLSRFTDFTPGHSKWDYDYSIGRKKPDVITHLWGGGREDAWPYLYKNYHYMNIAANEEENAIYDFWFRKNSENIAWNLLPEVE